MPGTPGALVLTHVHGWGTGVFRRSTSWYRIAKGEPSPLLSYPHDFYVVGWGMAFGRRLTSAALRMPVHLTQGAPLELRFDVNYTMEGVGACDESDTNLFSLTETLSLEWNDSASVFVPRTSSDDFARIEEIWGEGTEQFVERNAETPAAPRAIWHTRAAELYFIAFCPCSVISTLRCLDLGRLSVPFLMLQWPSLRTPTSSRFISTGLRRPNLRVGRDAAKWYGNGGCSTAIPWPSTAEFVLRHDQRL